MTWFTWFRLFEWLLALAMVPVLLRRRFPPATTLAWLALVFIEPIVGVIVYGLVGGVRLGRKRRRLHRRFLRAMRAKPMLGDQSSHRYPTDAEKAQRTALIEYNERVLGLPIVGGNAVELFSDTGRTIDRMIADIDAAGRHVHAVFYIFNHDAAGVRFAEALVRAARRGLAVRVLADAAGSRSLWGSPLPAMLKNAGVDLRPALPVNPFRRGLARFDIRNHRKLLVLDGQTAWTGSHNITDPGFTGPGRKRLPWIDLSGRFTGPVVGQLQVTFLEDWAFETDQTLRAAEVLPQPERTGLIAAQAVPTGPSDEGENFQPVLLAAVHAARQRLLITTPYLIPDEPLMLALAMAARRGVDVRIVLPRKSDHALADAAAHAYFDRLLLAGVKLFLFTPGLLHAKAMTVDDQFAMLGSANMDVRSFELNFELSVLMYGPAITHALESIQQTYLDHAKPVSLDQWQQRPWRHRFAADAAALLSPLL